eukprot:m.184301 g.184301  ORF g.184301 m.184301 type:complete len:450 (-) comp15558_c0_seq2:4583-5932(-)
MASGISIEDFLKTCDLEHLIDRVVPLGKTVGDLYDIPPEVLTRKGVCAVDKICFYNGLNQLRKTLEIFDSKHGNNNSLERLSKTQKSNKEAYRAGPVIPPKSKIQYKSERIAQADAQADYVNFEGGAEYVNSLASLYVNDVAMILQNLKSNFEAVNSKDVRKSSLQENRRRSSDVSSVASPESPSISAPSNRLRASYLDDEDSDSEDDTKINNDHEYENEDALALHTIDGFQGWNHGEISREEAEKRLSSDFKNGPGCFLVRQKKTQENTGRLFVLSVYCGPAVGVSHTLIQFDKNGEVLVDGKALSSPCKSLHDVVVLLHHIHSRRNNFPESQARGVEDSLLQEIREKEWLWNQPHLSRADARVVLSVKPPGTFLVRNSSQPAATALSIKTNESGSKMVFHTLILERPDGYQLQGTSFLARSKAELLRQLLMDQHGMAKAGIFVKLRL